MNNKDGSSYAFGIFVLDATQNLLLRGSEPVKLPAKAFELLLYFVQNPNQVVDKATLMAEVWKDTFVEDANLAVHISNLRKIFGSDEAGSAKIETFPKVGYRFVADVKRKGPTDPQTPLNGHQSVAEGTADVGATSSESNQARFPVRKYMVAAVAFLVIAGFALGVYIFNRNPASSREQPITSIAVLPLVNESGDPEFEYLTDGLTEMLIRNFSQLPGLSVKARTSVFQYKGKEIDPRLVGQELSAEAILIGRVLKTDNRLTLRYELVDAKSGNVILSEHYESDRGELVSLQNEISRSISSAIRSGSSGTDTRRGPRYYAGNREAYEFYLRGRSHLNRRTIADFKAAVDFFQKAIAIDPEFALAYTGLADSYILLVAWGGEPPAETMPQAKAAAVKALALDENLAEAHVSLAEYLGNYEYDLTGAERSFKRAIDLNPSYAQAYQWYAEILIAAGRFDDAQIAIRRAMELDPLSRMVRNIDGRVSLLAGRFDDAIAVYQKNIDLDPTWGGDHDMLFHAYEAKGMHPEAVEAHIQALSLSSLVSPSEIQLLRESFAKKGWNGFLLHRLRYLEKQSQREYVRPFQLSEFYARLRQNDKAFENLDKAFEKKSIVLSGWLKYLPCFDNLRSDPRYDDLVRRIGPPV